MSPVKPIPDGYHTLTVYLVVPDAARAIAFYKQALGARELFRLPGMNGQGVGHAEIQIGDTILMLADESPMSMANSPQTLGGVTSGMMLYVPDADAAFDRAVQAGATVLRPLADQFYGDRSGTVTDPFGYHWTLATHIEDVSPEELNRRMAEMASAS